MLGGGMKMGGLVCVWGGGQGEKDSEVRAEVLIGRDYARTGTLLVNGGGGG